jgi:uncharacterized protein involved in exopolysaccharide biosynthesis
MNGSEDDDSEGASGPVVPILDRVRSFWAYGVRAFRNHRKRALFTSGALMALTLAAVSLWPRSYTCTTVVASIENRVLDGERGPDGLKTAPEVILSRNNIEKIVDAVKLPKRWDETLSPAGRLKKRISGWFRGEPSAEAKRDALIGMVQQSISVTPPGWGQSKMIVSADWSDPQIAADLADAADKSFLNARRVVEISTITEYIEILEGHAAALREEIQTLASQSQGSKDRKIAELEKQSADLEPTKVAAPTYRAPAAPKRPVEDLSELRAKLEAKQQELKQQEDSLQRRRADAEAALTGLRSKFTPAHPMVVAAESNLALLTQDTPQIASVRAEVAALSAALKSKLGAEELAAGGGPRVSSVPPSAGTPGASSVEPLPADILKLMQASSEELDPAVGAQFRTAVAKFSTLRDKIGTARVDLDTAQAAFNHRYQIVEPAEVPNKPSKPKVPLMLAAGFLLSLVAGLGLAVVSELRKGRLVERWQVYQLGVPLLGEFRWPPTSDR